MIHCGCMGVPQELVDDIMDMLYDDLRALKACSLTCKAMFASTRHLIYHTLRLPPQSYRRDPTGFRSVSFMGRRGLLRYARQVHIFLPAKFGPDILLPHLHDFQSLDRVHTLTIHHYAANMGTRLCFIHFYSALTSLTLFRPFGSCRLCLLFALQFPNLDNLCFERLGDESDRWMRPDVTAFIMVNKPPPFGGRLRLVGAIVAQWPVDFASALPNGLNFRSVELEGLLGNSRPAYTERVCAYP
jgi:hypothetical protein